MEASTRNFLGGHTASWKVVSTKIPPSEYKKLIQKYPQRGQYAKMLRALIQMHLSGKIKELEFTITETM
jgi:hypothetical protein